MEEWRMDVKVLKTMTEGMRTGILREFRERMEIKYDWKNEQEREVTDAEVERLLDLMVLEEVENPDGLREVSVISPWVVVVKPGEIRPCLDMSATINGDTPAATFALPGPLDAMEYIRENEDTHGAIYDAQDFFFNVPIHKDDRRFFGVRHPGDGRILRYAKAPFGFVMSPFHGCAFSEEICVVLRKHGVKCKVFVDDWCILGSSAEQCQEGCDLFERLMKDINCPISPHKTQAPSKVFSWLGVEVDLRKGHMCFRLPGTKLRSIRNALDKFYDEYIDKRFCSPLALATLVGRLAFCSQVLSGGKAFLRRLYDKIKFASIDWRTGEVLKVWGNKPIPLDEEVWDDVTWWRKNVMLRNHTAMFPDSETRCVLSAGTDASDWGMGGQVTISNADEEFRIEFTEFERSLPINWRELAAVAVLCEKWGSRWRGARVCVHVDNMATVNAISRGSSRSAPMMELLRRLSQAQMHHGFTLEIEHISGVVHLRSDDLSRKDIETPPVAPRIRLDERHSVLSELLYGGIDISLGAEFEPSQGCQGSHTTVQDAVGKRIWCHPRWDEIPKAMDWLEAVVLADVTANTRAIMLLPNVPDSQWWSKIKHAKIGSVIPGNVRCMQRWTDVAWTGMLAPASGLIMVVFPRGAGEHIIPVKRLALYATDTNAVTVV
jgi:hypothetical protein